MRRTLLLVAMLALAPLATGCLEGLFGNNDQADHHHKGDGNDGQVDADKAPIYRGGPVQEDCLALDWQNLQAKRIANRWKIVDGNHWVADFGDKRDEAYKALSILRHYHATQMCYVGRPNPSMTYFLVGNQAPLGMMFGEDAVAFDPNNVRARQINGNWKVVDGDHWILDFGGNREEARQAERIIRLHGFSYICFVGRPAPSFVYFRR
jgi:predicted transposase YbfD/YdcC